MTTKFLIALNFINLFFVQEELRVFQEGVTEFENFRISRSAGVETLASRNQSHII